MSIMLKPVSDLYKKLVHVEGENAYPWLDRVISYGLPTAGAVLWSAFGTHAGYNLSGKSAYSAYWGLPAALAVYGGSQVGLTYLKQLVAAKEDDNAFTKTGKGVADFGVKSFDILNNIALYTVAFNMLPGTAGLNEVAAFRVMPEIVSGVESDIKAVINGTKYESEVAGRVFATAAAGFGAVNLRDSVAGKVKPAELEQKKNNYSKKEIDVYNQKLFDQKLTEALVESISYPFLKKLLMNTKYESNEIEQDILKTLTKELYKGSSIGKTLEYDFLKNSVFEGIPLFAAAECVPLALNLVSNCISGIDFDFCGNHPEICSVALSTAEITGSL
jgi:hypothetical protein